jgi:solute carrier family 25 folate transporter 32
MSTANGSANGVVNRIHGDESPEFLRMGSAAPASKPLLLGNFIAGISGGLVSSFLTHPLDLVLTRMQAQDGREPHIPRYKSTLSGLMSIVKHEGFLNLYAGIYPALLGSTASWGIYFLGYNYFRSLLRARMQLLDSGQPQQQNDIRDPIDDLGPLANLSCAIVTGCISTVTTQPIWLIKTRLQLQTKGSLRYNGMVHCFSDIVENEGVPALFRHAHMPPPSP